MQARKTLFTTTAVLSLLVAAPLLDAQTAAPAVETPGEVMPATESLSAVDDAMNRIVDEGQIAGGVVLIAQGGEVRMLNAYGQRDIEADAPMETDTIFRIFSMTKPVVTAAALILVDEGRLDPDDLVTKYVPEVEDLMVRTEDGDVVPNRPMTIADLMRHTAGFSYGFLGEPVDIRYTLVQPLGARDLEGMAERLTRLPLANHPGERWLYSLSIDVLGLVIERIAEQPLDQFLQERLFDPLDMPDTGFHCPAEKHDRFAALYGTGTGEMVRMDDVRFSVPATFFSGGAGLVSTASDYLNFMLMVRNGGELNGQRILQPETAALMITDQLPPESFPIGFGEAIQHGVGFGYGFSIRVTEDPADPHRPVGEYGWSGAASTHAFASIADDLIVITLEQRMPFNYDTAGMLKPLIYEAFRE